jgi:hypothetical protein
MQGIKYQAEICDSPLDRVHGFKYKIWEIFIPKYNIVFNEKGGLFKSDNTRNNCNSEVIEIEVNKADMLVLVDFLERKDDCAKIVKEYFSEIEEIL